MYVHKTIFYLLDLYDYSKEIKNNSFYVKNTKGTVGFNVTLANKIFSY